MNSKVPSIKNSHLVVCHALFEYLTSGLDSACAVYENELDRYRVSFLFLPGHYHILPRLYIFLPRLYIILPRLIFFTETSSYSIGTLPSFTDTKCFKQTLYKTISSTTSLKKIHEKSTKFSKSHYFSKNFPTIFYYSRSLRYIEIVNSN